MLENVLVILFSVQPYQQHIYLFKISIFAQALKLNAQFQIHQALLEQQLHPNVKTPMLLKVSVNLTPKPNNVIRSPSVQELTLNRNANNSTVLAIGNYQLEQQQLPLAYLQVVPISPINKHAHII